MNCSDHDMPMLRAAYRAFQERIYPGDSPMTYVGVGFTRELLQDRQAWLPTVMLSETHVEWVVEEYYNWVRFVQAMSTWVPGMAFH